MDSEYFDRVFLPCDLIQIVLGSKATFLSSPKHSLTLTHKLSNMHSHTFTHSHIQTHAHILTYILSIHSNIYMLFLFFPSTSCSISSWSELQRWWGILKQKESIIRGYQPQDIILKANLIFARTLHQLQPVIHVDIRQTLWRCELYCVSFQF